MSGRTEQAKEQDPAHPRSNDLRACPLGTKHKLRNFETYNTNPALLIALLIRWRGVADDARDDGRDRTCRAAVISARRRRVSSSRQSAASAFDRSSAISEIS